MPDRPATARRLAVPAALIAAGLWSLSGCFYVPSTRGAQVNGRPRPSRLAGGGDEPIRFGRTRIEDALVALADNAREPVPDAGRPGAAPEPPAGEFYLLMRGVASRDGSRVGLLYTLEQGRVVWPLCGDMNDADTRQDLIVLEVDPAGVVVGASTVADFHPRASDPRSDEPRKPYRLPDGTDVLPLIPAGWLDALTPEARRTLRDAGVLPGEAELAKFRSTFAFGYPDPAAPTPRR